MPAIVIIFSQVLPNNRPAAVIIGGVIPMALNCVIQGISFYLQKKQNEAGGIKDISDEVSGSKAFLFLFPARSSFLELFIALHLTGFYASLMTYFIHQQTLSFLLIDHT